MAKHLRMRRPRIHNSNLKCTTRSYQDASPEGLGSLSKLPREIRDQILGYIMDVSCKLEDYVTGIKKTPGEKYYDFFISDSPAFNALEIRREAYVGPIKPRYPFDRVSNFERPRRTDILAVSKAISGEAIAVMFRINRFILCSSRKPEGIPFSLFVLKEDWIHTGWQLTETSDLSFLLDRCYHRCPYLEDLSRYINAMLRFLVLDLRHDLRGFRVKRNENYIQMLKFIGLCKGLRSLRITMQISTHYKKERDLFLPVIQELSRLRSIRDLEVRGSLRHREWGTWRKDRFEEWKAWRAEDDSYQSSDTMINETTGTGIVFLTKDYMAYLKSAAQSGKGDDVRPYDGYFLTDDPKQMGLGDIEVEREHRVDAEIDEEEDQSAFEALNKARKAAGYVPWWCSKSIPAPESGVPGTLISEYVPFWKRSGAPWEPTVVELGDVQSSG